MNHFQTQNSDRNTSAGWGMPLFLERLRVRLGASNRQFMVFGLLLLTGGVMMARPAGMLLWHRLRIISGMPRTAIADQDPKIVSAHMAPTFEPVSVGGMIELDATLVRDPFDLPFSDTVSRVTTPESDPQSPALHPDLAADQSRLIETISSIRLTGTAKGLGTALVDGAVRTVGTRFEVSEYTFELIGVEAGAIRLEVVENTVFGGWRCIVDWDGATLLAVE